jgi:hypothetical protein
VLSCHISRRSLELRYGGALTTQAELMTAPDNEVPIILSRLSTASFHNVNPWPL